MEAEWVFIPSIKVDDKGRVLIPKRYREFLNLKPGDLVDLKVKRDVETVLV